MHSHNPPIPLALQIIPHIPPPMQVPEESEPRLWPNQPSGAATPGRPAKMDKAPKFPKPRPFWCGICGDRFTQSQVRDRHFRAKHKPSWCIFCDAPWSRSYLYRVHLERHHPDVDIDAVLGKAAGSSCRAASLARDSRQKPKMSPLAMAKQV